MERSFLDDWGHPWERPSYWNDCASPHDKSCTYRYVTDSITFDGISRSFVVTNFVGGGPSAG